jgi:hypothetical protein
MLKDCRYGLYMAAVFEPFIVQSKAIFPSNRSDDEAGGLILAVYLLTFYLLRHSRLSRCSQVTTGAGWHPDRRSDGSVGHVPDHRDVCARRQYFPADGLAGGR